ELSALAGAFAPPESAGNTWLCGCFPTFPRRKRSSRDPPADAVQDKATRVQSEGHLPSRARWHGRWYDRAPDRAQASEGPACPEFPGPFHSEAVIRVLAYALFYSTRWS